MACDPEWGDTVSAWLDGEVTREDAVRTERHVAGCPACARYVAAMRALGDRLRARRDDRVPETLAKRLATVGAKKRSRRFARIASLVVAAAIALVVFGVSSRAPSLPEALANDAIGHHVRGFARPEPCDFASSDPALVSRWCDETLGYPVEVPDLRGARLLGARRCNLEGVTTAALLYRSGSDALTVFVPRPGSSPAEDARRFAKRGARCVAGPLGTHVCSTTSGDRTVLAVAEREGLAELAVR